MFATSTAHYCLSWLNIRAENSYDLINFIYNLCQYPSAASELLEDEFVEKMNSLDAATDYLPIINVSCHSISSSSLELVDSPRMIVYLQ